VRPWLDVEPHLEPRIPRDLPFDPVDLSRADLSLLIARSEIDHGVGPVHDTPGGSEAGLARWEAFKASGLARYAEDRDDPLLGGVSRMSAYLHHGHVSALRLAREAAALPGPGPAKFLDELLVWRELAHAFAFRTPALESLEALPAWARETLAVHAADPRPAALSWERMYRGRTGDRLWDLCQASLRAHGELHNNLRMTWGKQVLEWTADPEAARRVARDLNHRLALDGRDPASYGGLLWCLGLFDRPFPPARPIHGVVRPRPTAAHAARLDLDALEARVRRPRGARPARVAVIGAGIAGLECARTLADHGLEVVVFEKSRGTSGRASTRREAGGGFDPGAQDFTARDPSFARLVESWAAEGLVASWRPRRARVEGPRRFVPEDAEGLRWVGVPGMSAIGRHLARDLDVRLETRVATAQPDRGGLRLARDDGADLGVFGRVVVAVPAPQAVPLLAASEALAARASEARLLGCESLLLTFDAPPPLELDVLRWPEGPLRFMAREASKPGRAPGERWVVLGRAGREVTEDPPEFRTARLVATLAEQLGLDPGPARASSKLWRYATAEGPFDVPCLWDPVVGLGAAGDWLVGPRIEDAWRSGRALAGRILETG
jgi:predicted NAD/FAD-dependent oxidoreductase